MKSLEKDRTRRYETADGFARDVERYLSGERGGGVPAVAAVPAQQVRPQELRGAGDGGRVRPRAGRGDGRERRACLAGGTGTGPSGEGRGTGHGAKGSRPRRQRTAIDAVKRFGDVIRASPELKNNPSLAPLRASLLGEPQAFFKQLRDRLEADKETSLDSLDRLATASWELGGITNEIGDKQDALHADERALAIRQRLVRENPSSEDFQAELAWTYRTLGNLKRELGRNDEAIASLEQAQILLGRLVQQNSSVAADPRNLSYRRNLAILHHDIGVARHAVGQRREAAESYTQGIAILERLVREEPSNDFTQFSLATSYEVIAHLQDAPESLASHERARTILELLTRDHPAEPEYQMMLAGSWVNIGTVYILTGRTAEALASYERALPIAERLTRENPSVTEYRLCHATCLLNLSNLRETTGQWAESAAALDEAQRVIERLIRENPTVVRFHELMAMCQLNMGQLRVSMGRLGEALLSFEKAAEISGRLAREHPESSEFASHSGVALGEIGAIYLNRRRFRRGTGQAHAGRGMAEEGLGPQHRAQILGTIGGELSRSHPCRRCSGARRRGGGGPRRAVQTGLRRPGEGSPRRSAGHRTQRSAAGE